jgi:hypothetical protein
MPTLLQHIQSYIHTHPTHSYTHMYITPSHLSTYPDWQANYIHCQPMYSPHCLQCWDEIQCTCIYVQCTCIYQPLRISPSFLEFTTIFGGGVSKTRSPSSRLSHYHYCTLVLVVRPLDSPVVHPLCRLFRNKSSLTDHPSIFSWSILFCKHSSSQSYA